MADEKLNTGPEEQKIPEAPEPVAADPAPSPGLADGPAATQEQTGPAQPAPGDVVVSFEYMTSNNDYVAPITTDDGDNTAILVDDLGNAIALERETL